MTIIHLFGDAVDVTAFEASHPGGRKLLKIFENRDASQQFSAIHKGTQAKNILKSMPKTPIVKVEKEKVEQEYDMLVVDIKSRLDDIVPLYECMKLGYILLFSTTGYLLCFHKRKYLGLLLLCLSMYQSGWVGHDYSHRSIFRNPKLNNAMAELLGFIQGYQDLWWKARHNTHHMVTNELGNDPDVRTEPVFHYFDPTPSKFKAHVPLQHLLFVPLLSLLDIFWRYESIAFLIKSPSQYFWYFARLALHYLLLASLVVFTDVSVFDLVGLSLVRGFMTASVVFANHYPEPRLPKKPSMGFFEQTLRTTRNTTGLFAHNEAGLSRSLFNESTGYLSMQIEHHLFPTLPSSRLMEVRPFVRALARAHNIPYLESSLLDALSANIRKLSSKSVRESFECVTHID